MDCRVGKHKVKGSPNVLLPTARQASDETKQNYFLVVILCIVQR